MPGGRVPLAVGVAVVLSPVAPLGSVRAVYPDPGIAADWLVLGGGAGVLIVVLAAVAVPLACLPAPHRAAVRRQRHPAQGSGVARIAREAGLPPSAVEGIRLALDPGAGRNAVPVRSAILGAAMAMIVMLATVTFGSSLATLVSRPALYGWNWTYALSSGTPTYIPRSRAAALLDHDPAVAAWTGVYYGTFKIDGLTVPVIGQSPRAPVGPPVLSGHGLRATGQIVLGPATLAALHKHVGDQVTVQSGAVRRTRLRIVGTATLPSLGIYNTLHTEMGTGSVLDYRVIPGAVPSQPNDILVHAAARSRSRGPAAAAGALGPGGERRPGHSGAASRRDRQLPVHGRHPRVPWRGPRCRGDRRAGADTDGLRPPALL